MGAYSSSRTCRRRTRGSVGDAVDETVGVEAVLHRQPLAEELGVPDDRRAGCAPGQVIGQLGRSPHRHGGLPDDDVALGHHAGERLERRVEMGQVGGVRALLLRRPDADEVDRGACDLGEVRGEPQPAALDTHAQKFGQPRFVERSLPGNQRLDLLAVDVHADDVMTERSHRGSVNRPEIATTSDRYPHQTPLRVINDRRATAGRPDASCSKVLANRGISPDFYLSVPAVMMDGLPRRGTIRGLVV